VSNVNNGQPLSEAMPPAGVEEQNTRKGSRRTWESRVRPDNSVLVRIEKGEPKPMMNERANQASDPSRSGGSQGWTKGMQTAATGRTRSVKPCHRCWRAYVQRKEHGLPSLTRVRSVCGKAARTDGGSISVPTATVAGGRGSARPLSGQHRTWLQPLAPRRVPGPKALIGLRGCGWSLRRSTFDAIPPRP